MPSINFMQCFEKDILAGRKTQAIRPKRKRTIKVGDPLYIFTGLRTPSCKRLLETTCIGVMPLSIDGANWRLNGVLMDPADQEDLAMNDGFRTPTELMVFLQSRYEMPFTGELIRWKEPCSQPAKPLQSTGKQLGNQEL